MGAGRLRSFPLSVSSDMGRRRRWHPTPVFLPGNSYGWRSLVGCSPWGPKESDTTERLHFHFSLSYIGEGNGNPLQCSCLENPRDRGALWAAVYGVAQSQTRLKRLSSSSSIKKQFTKHPQECPQSFRDYLPTLGNWRLFLRISLLGVSLISHCFFFCCLTIMTFSLWK